MSLTKRQVDALYFTPHASSIAWDSKLPGFGCRVFASGVKSFILDYRDATGRKKRITLGRYGPLTPDEARKRARQNLNAVSGGADPLDERRARREALSVEEMGATYIERHARPHKKSWRDDARRLTANVYPAFGHRPLASLTRADVLKLHKDIGQQAPFEANRTIALLGTLWNVAEDHGLVPSGAPNPARRIKKFPEPSRDRWVTEEEMPRLMSALRNEPDESVRTYFLMLLCLGTRKQELLGAKWAHLDAARRELRIAENKASRPLVLPLPDRVVTLFASLPRLLGNTHILPSPVVPGAPRKDVKNEWNRIRKEAGLADVSIHDLRRTAGSWMATQGVSLITIGRILNHAESGVTEIYARLASSSLREALEAHADRILAVWDASARAGIAAAAR